MATPQSTIQRSLAGGELAPALHARADQVKYVTGLRTCRNFVVQRHGGVSNRAGTRHVARCKTDAIQVGLMRYVSENVGESVLWEVGNGYLRPYVGGARLLVDGGSVPAYSGVANYVIGDLVISGGIIYYSLADQVGVAPPGVSWHAFDGINYELPSPFGVDIPHWNQSGRTITLTHKNKAPYELINGGALTVWILRKITTATPTPAPAGLGVVAGTAGTTNVGYVVTAAAADTFEESIASGQVINPETIPTPAAPDALTWTAVPGAAEYYVYCDVGGNGIYGYIGTAQTNLFNAIGTVPDYTITPPVARVLFNAAGDFPDRSGSFQQRRLFGFTNNVPDGVFGSRIGFPSNFGISQPLQDDDAITFRIAGNNHNPIKHLLALKNLIAATGAGAWIITGGGPNLPLTPSQLEADQHTYTGFGDVVPVIVGNSIIYVQARGSVLFDLQFDQQVEGLGGRDLCIFSDHLFKGHAIDEIDYAETPDSVIWCCREDGILLGLTYIREQEVWGWHRHDSGAACRFEHVCVVPEVDGDTVYFITRRTIDGGFHRSIEKLEKRLIVNFNTDAFFVDAGLSYHGIPQNNVAGLGHLEGQVVAVVGDGQVLYDGNPAGLTAGRFTVTGGTFPLNFSASYSDIHVGLPITAEVETLDLDVQGSNLRDKKKRVGSLTVLLEKGARSFLVGPDAASAVIPVTLESFEGQLARYTPFTGPVEVNLTSAFNDNGRVFIRHTLALPLTILGLLPNVELGG